MSHNVIEWDVSNNTHSSKPDKTPPLILVSWARENKVVFDFETGKFIFKDDPNLVYSAKAGRQANGQIGNKPYWLIPLIRNACRQTRMERFRDQSIDQQSSFGFAPGVENPTPIEDVSGEGKLRFFSSHEYTNDDEWHPQ